MATAWRFSPTDHRYEQQGFARTGSFTLPGGPRVTTNLAEVDREGMASYLEWTNPKNYVAGGPAIVRLSGFRAR
jgi:hypothetical protein